MKMQLSPCVAFGVPNMRQAAEFYQGVLGFTIKKETAEWIELDSGSIRMYLCQDDVQTPVFDLQVEDIEAARVYLNEHGFKKLDFSDEELFMQDPFGFSYCISLLKEPAATTS